MKTDLKKFTLASLLLSGLLAPPIAESQSHVKVNIDAGPAKVEAVVGTPEYDPVCVYCINAKPHKHHKHHKPHKKHKRHPKHHNTKHAKPSKQHHDHGNHHAKPAKHKK